MRIKRILCAILALCMVFTLLSGVSFVVSATNYEIADVKETAEQPQNNTVYGLAENIQDGNILHCFNWKYNDIKAELKSIAEAGFTSVQTSPAQPAGSGAWYWLYQPFGFYIGSNPIGTKDELESLCTEADKYGIKVIVDVVANNLNVDTNSIQDDLKDGQYWHNLGSISSWTDRYQVTHCDIGMRDLNSEHPYVQQVVAKYMKELEGVGVDGVRWDAAKHISLPSENCQFWATVTKGNRLWHYGEILDTPVANNDKYAESLMKEYINYMSVTDTTYGSDVRNAFNSGRVPSKFGNWIAKGIASDKLVLWAESYDTYSNGPDDWDASTYMSQNVIDRAYAIVASREGSNAIYLSRPSATEKNNINSGQKGSIAFKNKEVTAINHFKNDCIGEAECYVTENNVAAVCRENGAVIVLGSGGNENITVTNGDGITKPGSYMDLVSGSIWTVTDSEIIGQVGKNGIAVLLNSTLDVYAPYAYVTPESTNYTTDTFEVTLNFENAVIGQCSINGGDFQSFENGQKITIGKGTEAGTQTILSVKASDGERTSEIKTYEYNYVVYAEPGIYFDNSSTNWGSVWCYIYKDGQSLSSWPGKLMKHIGNDIWYFEAPDGYENCQVIFSDYGQNQYPTDQGLRYAGTAMICEEKVWREYTIPDTESSTDDESTIPATTTLQTEPIETEPVTQPQQPYDYIYFKDSAGWGEVNCHSWNVSGSSTEWPGRPMESIGNGIFRIQLPEGHTNIVFNSGTQQTSDLVPQFGKIYNNSTNQWEEELPALISGTLENGLSYSEKVRGEVTITGYSGGVNYVVIPSTIEGISVRTIDKGTFSGAMTRVYIPKSITNIEEGAFTSDNVHIFYPDTSAVWKATIAIGDNNEVLYNGTRHYCITDTNVYKKVTVESTCTEKGYTMKQCICCNDSYEYDFTDTIPHFVVDGICTGCKQKYSVVESEHPYGGNTNSIWTVSVPGADYITLTFSSETEIEDKYDYIYIYDDNDVEIGKYTGDALADEVITIDGEIVKIKLVADDSGNAYGFRAEYKGFGDKIVTEPNEPTTEPTVVTDPTEATTESTVVTDPTEVTTEFTVATDPTEATTESATVTDPTEVTTESTAITDPTEVTTELTVVTDPTDATTESATVIDPTEVTTESTVVTDSTEATTESSVVTDPTEPFDTTEPSTGDDTKPSEPVVDKGILGDVNGDGKVNIKDATLIQKAVAKIISLTDAEQTRADVNADEKVNIKDATAIQKFVAKIETGFPVGESIVKKVNS